MKIYCNREYKNKLNQLINDKAALESEFNEKVKQYKDENKKFDDAVIDWKDNVRVKLQNIIRKYPTIGPDIAITPDSMFEDYILCIELKYQRQPIWRYRIVIHHSRVDTRCAWDSGSDDRLTQQELVNRLQETAALISELANTNWNIVLDDDIRNMPIYSRYVTIENPIEDLNYKSKKDDVDKEILECELSNLIGKDFWIKCEGYYSDQPCRWLKLYRKIAGKIEYNIIEENIYAMCYDQIRDYLISGLYDSSIKRAHATITKILSDVDIIYPLNLVTTQELIDILQYKIDTCREE